MVVVSGPSGVGKTTVVERLLRRNNLPLRRAVTATTRDQRVGEIDGISYHFWSRDEFRRATEDGRMLEWALVFDRDYYGTPRSEVDQYRAIGVGVVLVIDVQGAATLKAVYPQDRVSIFVMTPSFEALEQRLRSRQDTTEDRVLQRLQTAREEVARAGEFDHRIINRDLEEAVNELEAVVRSQFRMPPHSQPVNN